MKESEKLGKYIDLPRELKTLWNMKVTVIPIVGKAFRTVSKKIKKRFDELRIRGRIENTLTTALLKLAWIFILES